MKIDINSDELQSSTVLVIEDNPHDQRLLTQILEAEGIQVELASCRRLAYESIDRQRPDLILLDVTLPKINGFDLCKELTSDGATASIPIVFLSVLNEEVDILRGFEVGGRDFISKPIRQELLLARVRTQLHISSLQKTLYQFNKNLEQLVQRRTRELQVSEERLDYALESLSGGIWDWDLGTGRVYFSPKCLGTLGYLPIEMPKSMLEWGQLLHADDRAGTVEIRQNYIEGGGDSLDVVYRIIAKDGSYRWQHDRGLIAERDPYGQPLRVVGISQDITENIKTELLNKKLENHVSKARKMESLGTLAGGLAHEFNNILAVAFGLLDLEKMENHRAHGPVSSNLQKMDVLLHRAKGLVEEILTFSTHSSSDKQVLNLVEACEEVVSYLRDTAPENISLILNHRDQVIVSLVNRTQIHQIISNLFNNSVYALQGRRGEIRLVLDSVVIEEGDIPLTASLQPGKYARLEFFDSGSGMGDEQLARLFEPFYTTKKEDSGTGMGLAIVHGIVNSYGGHIDVCSQEGESTCFKIYVPLYTASAADKTIRQAGQLNGVSDQSGGATQAGGAAGVGPSVMAEQEKIRVLFVDDEPEMTGIISTLLTQYGLKVSTFESPMMALEEFVRHSDRYSIVVTDQSMPEMTGLDLVKKMKQCNCEVPVLILTGLNDFQTQLADSEQLLEVCTKPINIEDLVKTIRRLCQSV